MSNKYNRRNPTIIKFSEVGAKFMQLNMIAHDYAHDFNPGASIGKDRIKQSFDHVLNITKYVNDPITNQFGGFTSHAQSKKAHRVQNIIGKKNMTSKFIKINRDNKKKTNKYNIILTKPSSPAFTASFSRKINMLTELSRPRFILFFYNKFLEEGIYVYIYELLGFINYSGASIKNNHYLKHIKNAFKYYKNHENKNPVVSKYINPTINNLMHELYAAYFDIIYNENRHACYLNILKDNILIQKLKIGFILLANSSEKMLKKITIPDLINYIDSVHVQLFSYLYYSDINMSSSKLLLGLSSVTASGNIGSSGRMSGGNALFGKEKQTSIEDCLHAENKINELKEYVRENIYTDDSSVIKNGANYLQEEIKKLFVLTPNQEKNIKNLYITVKPSSRNSEQKRDSIVDSIFSYIATIFSANCGELIRFRKEEELRKQREEAFEENAIEVEERGELSGRMTNVGWNIVGILAKTMLIRNNICTNTGDFTEYYENILKNNEDTIEKKMLEVEVNILQKMGFPKNIKNNMGSSSDLDDILKTETIKILENHPQNIKSKKSFNTLLNIKSTGNKIFINNAVTLFENKIDGLKEKIFCPLSSVLDAMSSCSPSTIVNNPETFESGITHFTIVGEDESLPYFNGIMEFVNKDTANIFIEINNKGFDSLIYEDKNISIKGPNILQASTVFKNQAEYIIKCLSSMHEIIIVENKTSKDLIWDLFMNWQGPQNQKYYFTNQLIKIGNRKSLGDIFQEINGVCKNGAYIQSSYRYGKKIVPHFSKLNINAPRVVLSNDRPSGVRIAFMLTSAIGDSINPNSAGGFSGGEGGEGAILLSRVPLEESSGITEKSKPVLAKSKK